VTDDSFLLALERPEDPVDVNVVRQLFSDFNAVGVTESEL
jgi:hypothetical protein